MKLDAGARPHHPGNLGSKEQRHRGDTDGVWEERAHRARREIAALASTGLGVSELHAAAIRVIEHRVGAELTCWASIDPENLVISSMTSGDARIPVEYEPMLAAAEYSGSEPQSYAALARSKIDSATLADMSAHDRARCARLNTVWRPLGLDEELRVMFRTDATCWGAAGMVRARSGFSGRETEFLLAVAPVIAAATRLAVRLEARGWASGGPPAVVVVGLDGRLRAITPTAAEWQDRFNMITPDRFRTMMQVMASGAHASTTGGFRARLRDAYGNWAFLEASPLTGEDDDQVAVTIAPATGDHLLGLLLAAYGLSAREREVCREVISGHSTTEIAHHLFISAHTVQDHLKSIFGKVGVRSRGELVARLRAEG